VVGGECTLAIALYSAAVADDQEVALLYFDGGQDPSNDPDNPESVWTGLACATCWICRAPPPPWRPSGLASRY
jgi:arginase